MPFNNPDYTTHMVELVEAIFIDLAGAVTKLDNRNEGSVIQSKDEAFQYSSHAYRHTRHLREMIHELNKATTQQANEQATSTI